MPPPADTDLLDFAVSLAREAGTLTLDWFQRADLAVDHKGDGTPVTAADLAAEIYIRERLTEAYPEDGIHGEEHGNVVGTSGRTWVIDPIDGTKAFTKGVPLYSTLLALVDEAGPAIGVIHLPGLDETVWAGRGLGCFHNGETCQVSDHDGLDGAYVMTSGFSYWPDGMIDHLIAGPSVLRTWGDAYGYTLVATGRAEAMIDPQANPWDVAPVAVIIAEAGGRFTGIDGTEGPDAWSSGSGLATNGRVHDDLLDLMHP